jgi:hypothetical protein
VTWHGGAVKELLDMLAENAGTVMDREAVVMLVARRMCRKRAELSLETAKLGAMCALALFSRRGYAEVAWMDSIRAPNQKGWTITMKGVELWECVREPEQKPKAPGA